MPKLEAVTSEELASLKPKREPKGELIAPYVKFIEELEAKKNPAGRLTLDPEDDQRTVKRRVTSAAKSLGKNIKWKSAPEGQLLFIFK